MSHRPIPTKLKILRGEKNKDRINKNEPQPDKTPPSCPSWLPYQARAEWKRIVPELERLGLLTMVDRAALAGYCEAYARWVKAAKALKSGFTNNILTETKETKDGETIIIIKQENKPEVIIARDALNQVRAFCIEFGLTPSSRTKLSVPGDTSQDPLDKLLGTVKN